MHICYMQGGGGCFFPFTLNATNNYLAKFPSLYSVTFISYRTIVLCKAKVDMDQLIHSFNRSQRSKKCFGESVLIRKFLLKTNLIG